MPANSGREEQLQEAKVHQEAIKDHRHLIAAICHRYGDSVELSEQDLLAYDRDTEGIQWTLVLSIGSNDRVAKIAVAKITTIIEEEKHE